MKIKECNFKNEREGCTLKDNTFNTHIADCSGEKNCIIFQTYINTCPKRKRQLTKAPKKPKAIKYTKDGKMRHPPTAMRKLLKQVNKKK